MMINLINEMEMKNAAYAADLFAIEKNGLNQAFRIEFFYFFDTTHIIWLISYGPYQDFSETSTDFKIMMNVSKIPVFGQKDQKLIFRAVQRLLVNKVFNLLSGYCFIL